MTPQTQGGEGAPQVTRVVSCVRKQEDHVLPIEHVRQHPGEPGIAPGDVSCARMRRRVDAVAQIHEGLHGDLQLKKQACQQLSQRCCTNAALACSLLDVVDAPAPLRSLPFSSRLRLEGRSTM